MLADFTNGIIRAQLACATNGAGSDNCYTAYNRDKNFHDLLNDERQATKL